MTASAIGPFAMSSEALKFRLSEKPRQLAGSGLLALEVLTPIEVLLV
jgi:hypothetical protein